MDKIIAIAIDEYTNSPSKNLKNCANDINSIVQILKTDYEYDPDDSEIIIYSKPEQTTLSYLYSSLNQEFFNALESDRILLIFAGHGEYNEHLETGYWVCSDSNFDDPTTWFDLNILISFFSHSNAKNIAFISDSCFSGSIFTRYRGGGLDALSKNSRQALTSGGLEKVSDGKENENSPFNKAMQLTLTENEQENFTFTSFCETTIERFPITKNQTPVYGSLNIKGNAGGTYIFKKKTKSITSGIFHNEALLSLEIDKRINIDSKISIPFFSGKTNVDLNFINIYVQQLGYKIINDIRVFASEDLQYLIDRSSEYPFEVESGYTVNRLDEEYLSISLSQYEYFGTPHPNFYMYSLNFKLKPTIKVKLFEVFDINYIDGLTNLIKEFSDDDCEEELLKVLENINIDDLDFSFNDDTLCLYFINHLPHALKACGIVEIPLGKVAFRQLS